MSRPPRPPNPNITLAIPTLHFNQEDLPAPPSPVPSSPGYEEEGDRHYLSPGVSAEELNLVEDVPVYHNKLYNLQQSAPKPKPIICHQAVENHPFFYGKEFHGCISRDAVSTLLGKTDGNYLVRESMTHRGAYSLSFVLYGEVKHYLPKYLNGKHVIGIKEFDTLYALVQDGLITMYVEREAKDYIQRMPTVRRPVKKSQVYEEVDEPADTDGLCVPQMRQHKPMRSRKTVRVSSFFESETDQLQKEHNFKINTYWGFPWCHFCNNFLWGLSQQGFKCTDCGYDVHHQCLPQVQPYCKPDKKKITKVFGVDLTTTVKIKSTNRIPNILQDCITIVENKGLQTEGIYRVNGGFDNVKMYKELYDTGNVGTSLNGTDVFVVCSLLKQYFRELPLPLITYDAYLPFVTTNETKDHDDRIGQVKDAMRILPEAHFHSLKAIIQHLHRVTSHAKKNHMTSENLAIVFGPTLFRSPELTADKMILDMAIQKMTVKFLIENYERLFR